MTHKLKLGWKASAEQFGPRQLLDFAVLAEQLGFESGWISDHFQPWRHTDGHAPFSMAWLAAVGERTQRMTLGTSVLTPTFRYHPSIVAQAFGTMGAMTAYGVATFSGGSLLALLVVLVAAAAAGIAFSYRRYFPRRR